MTKHPLQVEQSGASVAGGSEEGSGAGISGAGFSGAGSGSGVTGGGASSSKIIFQSLSADGDLPTLQQLADQDMEVAAR